jgi:hypothetical protein
MYRLVPKIGPFRALSFSVPTPEAERLFLASFVTTRERFKQSLDAVRAANLHLINTDFDTGKPSSRGEYALADDTYDELLEKLAGRRFATVSENLRSNLVAHYGDVRTLPVGTEAERDRSLKVRIQLALLFAVQRPWQRP